MRRALVTGAGGFIGQALVKALCEAGVHVIGVARTRRDSPGDAAEWLNCDIRDPQIRDATSRVDVVFHLAARVHMRDRDDVDAAAHWDVNVEGTRNLLEGAAFHGVRKFVFFSSVKAMGERTTEQLDETSVPAPVTPYGRSKLAAETLVREAAAAGTMQAVSLRLPMVWGPGGAGNMTRMVRAIAHRRFPPLPELGNRRSLVHVRDVVQAALLAGGCEHPEPRTYLVTDGRAYSTREMYAEICCALGRSVSSWHVPVWNLRLLASLGDAVGALTGERMFDSAALEKLSDSAWYDSSAISRDLGYVPAVTLEAGLPEFVRSLNLSSPTAAVL